MPNKNSNRMGRIDEEYRKELSNIISYKLKNPNATGLISVTKVKVTNDLKYAKVYVSVFGKTNKNKVIEALTKAKGFIKKELGRRVRMRNMPELIFELDNSMEYGAHIQNIINELGITQDEENEADAENDDAE